MTVALVEADGRVVFGHVGDSRAYLLRDGKLEQLTDDHSLVAELVRRGELSPAEAEVHPQRSVITRALGTDPDVDVDTFAIEARAGRRLPALLRRALVAWSRRDDRADPRASTATTSTARRRRSSRRRTAAAARTTSRPCSSRSTTATRRPPAEPDERTREYALRARGRGHAPPGGRRPPPPADASTRWSSPPPTSRRRSQRSRRQTSTLRRQASAGGSLALAGDRWPDRRRSSSSSGGGSRAEHLSTATASSSTSAVVGVLTGLGFASRLHRAAVRGQLGLARLRASSSSRSTSSRTSSRASRCRTPTRTCCRWRAC